jgi:hypothetical protein
MSQPYPIISQQKLKESPRRGLLNMRGPRRPDDEVPTLNPHEVLVYRVNGKFIVDDGQRRPDHNQVVNASSVTVVNMRRGADVSVSFEIASRDAAVFTVQVTFTCSVVDAITVVRDGQVNAGESLLAYMKGYQPLFELGLAHPLADINVVRRKAGLHVKAYMTVCPPEIPGMSIDLANVQVMTPQELAGHEERRRNEEREQALATERLQRERDLKRQRQEVERSLKEQQQDADHSFRQRQQTSDQTFNLREQESDYQRKLLAQENEHLLSRRDREHRIDEFEGFAQIVGDNPRQALRLAHIRGELSADDLARRLRELDDEDKRWVREVADAETLAREKAAEIRRSEAREAAAIKRADDRAELEWNRERDRDETAYNRATAEREAKEALDQRKQAIEIELEILREFNKRGLLDNFYPDFKEMMRRVRGEPISEEPGELTAGSGDDSTDDLQKDDADLQKDDDLREEDGD